MAITLDDINKWAKKKNKGKLLSSLATDNYKLQVAAINALADIGGEEIVEPLIKMLKKEAKTEIIDDKYLGPMTKEIMAKNPGSSLDALIKNMNWDEGYREIRKAAAKALGMLRSPKSIESLTHTMLNDIDQEVKLEATAAIAHIKGINIQKYGGVENIPLAELLAK